MKDKKGEDLALERLNAALPPWIRAIKKPGRKKKMAFPLQEWPKATWSGDVNVVAGVRFIWDLEKMPEELRQGLLPTAEEEV
jgi:hypothetical protein